MLKTWGEEERRTAFRYRKLHPEIGMVNTKREVADS
jgi:hypothetical protein